VAMHHASAWGPRPERECGDEVHILGKKIEPVWPFLDGLINVLGFMNRKNDLHPFIFEQSVHTEVVIACFDEFSKTLKKKTVVVMDNASVHISEEFEECLPQWKKQGLIIKYLTTYSPELNLIEILWRNIKYAWLPFSAYQCLNALREALENILKNFGSEYQITFA
jgi:hypothetical protein